MRTFELEPAERGTQGDMGVSSKLDEVSLKMTVQRNGYAPAVEDGLVRGTHISTCHCSCSSSGYCGEIQ